MSGAEQLFIQEEEEEQQRVSSFMNIVGNFELHPPKTIVMEHFEIDREPTPLDMKNDHKTTVVSVRNPDLSPLLMETTTSRSESSVDKSEEITDEDPVDKNPLVRLKRSSVEVEKSPTKISGKKIHSFPLLPELPSVQANYFTFCLQKQPYEIQRRSYTSEARIILPKPLVVCTTNYRDDPLSQKNMFWGHVKVDLVDAETGKKINNDDRKVLGGSIDESFYGNSVKLYLQAFISSSTAKYQLLFNIQFKSDPFSGSVTTEELYSSAFYIVSHNKVAKKLKNEGKLTQQ